VSPVARKLLISSVSLVAAVAALEVGLRAAGYDPLGELHLSGQQDPGELLGEGFLREAEHDILVYEFAPGARAHAWGADVEINAHGFRDREFQPAKPAGTTRIVALGDSATFGIRLPTTVLWPKVLERLLREDGRAVEVLNLGIVGYDTLEEVAFLETTGLAFQPDHVVVAYHLNDAGFASPTRDYVRRLQSYGSPLYRSRVAQGLRRALDLLAITQQQQRTDRDDYFARENAAWIQDVSGDADLAAKIDALRAAVAPAEFDKTMHRYLRWYRSPARIGKLRTAFERLAGLAAEHGFEVWVFPVPWLSDEGVEAAYDLGYAIARHEAERARLTWIDPLPETRALGHRALMIQEHDYGHPNAAGHRALAERVARELTAR
jgi:lysophospholipase L1-like esterase